MTTRVCGIKIKRMAKAKLPEDILEFFRKHGARGGKIGGSAGGKKAAAGMTQAQRTERAKKAVAAREAKRNGEKGRGG
jgi:hypothetical protein